MVQGDLPLEVTRYPFIPGVIIHTKKSNWTDFCFGFRVGRLEMSEHMCRNVFFALKSSSYTNTNLQLAWEEESPMPRQGHTPFQGDV